MGVLEDAVAEGLLEEGRQELRAELLQEGLVPPGDLVQAIHHPHLLPHQLLLPARTHEVVVSEK